MQAGREDHRLYMLCMVQMEAQENLDELRLLLVQAEVELLGQEVEASEVEEEEGTDKLSETSESRELLRIGKR